MNIPWIIMEQIYLTTNDKFTAIVQVRSLSNGWRHLHNYGISWKHTGGWTSNLDASQDSYPSNSSSKKIPFSEEKKNCPKLNKLHNPIRSPPAAGYFSWVVNQIVHEMHVLPFLILFVGDNFSEDKISFFFFCFNCHDFIKIEYFSVERMLLSCTVKCTDQFLIHIYSFGNPNP